MYSARVQTPQCYVCLMSTSCRSVSPSANTRQTEKNVNFFFCEVSFHFQSDWYTQSALAIIQEHFWIKGSCKSMLLNGLSEMIITASWFIQLSGYLFTSLFIILLDCRFGLFDSNGNVLMPLLLQHCWCIYFSITWQSRCLFKSFFSRLHYRPASPLAYCVITQVRMAASEMFTFDSNMWEFVKRIKYKYLDLNKHTLVTFTSPAIHLFWSPVNEHVSFYAFCCLCSVGFYSHIPNFS